MKNKTLIFLYASMLVVQLYTLKVLSTENITVVQLDDEQLKQVTESVRQSVGLDLYVSNFEKDISDLETEIENKTEDLLSRIEVGTGREQSSSSVTTREPQINKQEILSPQFNEQQRVAATAIEERLDAALSAGAWTAKDSESIIVYSSQLSYKDRLRLLDRFADAVDQGLGSVAEYPPPI